ncbi:hypothetical protein F7725_007644, partial [Dissostichus mawsoni]
GQRSLHAAQCYCPNSRLVCQPEACLKKDFRVKRSNAFLPKGPRMGTNIEVLVLLYSLAHGLSLSVVTSAFGIPKSTVHRIIKHALQHSLSTFSFLGGAAGWFQPQTVMRVVRGLDHQPHLGGGGRGAGSSLRIKEDCGAEATRTGGLIEGLAPMASSMAMKKGHVAGVSSP